MTRERLLSSQSQHALIRSLLLALALILVVIFVGLLGLLEPLDKGMDGLPEGAERRLENGLDYSSRGGN